MVRERDDGTVMVATRIPKSLHRRLQLYCVEEEVTMMSVVTAAIDEALRRGKKPKPE
jgi:hypothetical protein